MTKVSAPATEETLQHEEGQSSPLSSFYSPRRLKLHTLAEIKHCETSKTITKYIEAKTIQDKNTGMTHTRQECSLSIDVIIKHLLTSFWSRLKLENMTHTTF